MNPLRIIFMGTPEFAVQSLELLIEHKFTIVAVITAPDKPQGRGQKLIPSPVKVCAINHGVPVLQPLNLKSPDFLEELKAFHADLFIVVAFRMLPELVWSMPARGTFNLHASLLPEYRGAAPINWAIINGEKETGVTTFFLKHEIDTGSIIFQEREPIQDDDDAGSLYERLMHRGAKLVVKTARAIERDEHHSVPQTETGASKHAPKIFKETCSIRWDQPSKKIRDFIRGLSPYPAAWTIFHDKTYKIFRVTEVNKNSSSHVIPGHVDTDNKDYLHICTSDGWIAIEELQPDGKKRMSIKDFFRGNKI